MSSIAKHTNFTSTTKTIITTKTTTNTNTTTTTLPLLFFAFCFVVCVFCFSLLVSYYEAYIYTALCIKKRNVLSTQLLIEKSSYIAIYVNDCGHHDISIKNRSQLTCTNNATTPRQQKWSV